jgi:hypothetical protein
MTSRTGVFGEEPVPLSFCPVRAHMAQPGIALERPRWQVVTNRLSSGTVALQNRLITSGYTAVVLC